MAADQLKQIEFKESIIQKLENSLTKDPSEVFSSIKGLIREFKDQAKLASKQNEFSKNIHEVNAEFKDQLIAKYPTLTPSEVDICGYVLMGLNDHEISIFRSTSSDAIKTARYRIRKKMHLKKTQSIATALKTL